jgi:hypothetical protein
MSVKFPGAPYADIAGDGSVIVQGHVPVGDGLLRYLRCSLSGRKWAGADGSDGIWEWNGETWQNHGKGFGPRCFIYRGEELLIWRENSISPPEAKGFRYIAPDGTAVHASPDTLHNPALRLWEYTNLSNGYKVGQGGGGADGEDPVIIVTPGGVRRLVKRGQCRFINAYLIGDAIAAAWNEPGGCDAVFIPVTEVDTLPVAAEPNDDVVDPVDPPEAGMELPKAIYDTYKAVAEKFITLHRSPNDRDRAEANRRGVSTIRRRHRGQGALDGRRYVCKTEHRNEWTSDSKDAIGYIPPEFADLDEIRHNTELDMHMFDMINGTSRTVNSHPIKSHNRTDDPPNPTAYALIPEDKDWLAEDTDPVDPGNGDQEPAPIARTKKHVWWRGDTENRDDCNHPMTDGGDCDRGKDDPIHAVVVEEPKPVCSIEYPNGARGNCPACDNAKSKHDVLVIDEPDPAYHEPVPHKKNPKVCSECLEAVDAPIHKKPTPPPPAGEPFDDTRILEKMDEVLNAIDQQTDVLRIGFKQVSDAVAKLGGKSGNILDDILGPKKEQNPKDKGRKR